MYWITNETGDLVNLAKAKFINVSPLDESEYEEDIASGRTHAVVVILSDEESDWLFTGSESACIEFRNGLMQRLSRINSDPPNIEFVCPRPPWEAPRA